MKRILAGVVLVLLLSSALVPFAAAAPTDTPTPGTNATTTATATPTATPEATPTPVPESAAETSGYTLEELERGGTLLGNAPESVRMTDTRQFWLIHWPARAVTSNPGEDDKWTHVTPGARVDRNAVYLRSILFSEETVHVKVVTWRRGERVIGEGNESRAVPVPKNVTTSRQKVTLAAGWPMAKIPLEQHNEPVQVTMWIEEYPSVRWRFSHESVPTTQNAGIDSEGDYLVRLATDVVGPALVGVFVVGWLVRRAIDKAGTGPLKGFGFWFIMLGVSSGLALLFLFDSLAELLVAAPKVIAVLLVAIVGIVMLETFTSNVERWDFIQLETTPATSPSGEELLDTRGYAKRHERLVRMPNDGLAVVRPGILRFLARCFGGASRLRNAGEIRTEIRETGSSRTDKMVLTHPDHAEGPLEYEPEGFELSIFKRSADPLADGDRELHPPTLFKVALSTLGAWFLVGTIAAAPFDPTLTGWAVVGEIFLSLPAIAGALVAFAITGLRAADAFSLVVPAPAHLTAAFASSAILAEEMVEGETIEEFAEENRRLRVRDQREIEERVAEGERTLIEEMHGYDPDDRERTDANGSEPDPSERAERDASENGSADAEDETEVFEWS